MNYFSRLFLLMPMFIATVDGNSQTNFSPSNPFYSESKLPYQAPAFDKIKDSDFKPAIEEGMRVQLLEIETIANDPKPPTFENTLVAMEKSGRLLDRAGSVFTVLTAANTNPELQKLRQELAPKQAALRDAIYLNTKLFKRVETLYNTRTKLKLDAESNRLVEFYYQRFVQSNGT